MAVMPVCVCGHAHLSQEVSEFSCCSQHENDKSKDSEDVAESCIHDQKTFIIEKNQEEKLFPEVERLITAVNIEEWELLPTLSTTQLRGAPPDFFPKRSRNITYCTYRL